VTINIKYITYVFFRQH